jgi:hypothetical protein
MLARERPSGLNARENTPAACPRSVSWRREAATARWRASWVSRQRGGRLRPGRGNALEGQQDAAFGVDLEGADRRGRQLTREGHVGTGLRAGRALASLVAEEHRQPGHAQGEHQRGGQVQGAAPQATAGLLLFLGAPPLGFGALPFGLGRATCTVELALLLRRTCGRLELDLGQAGLQEAPLERDQLAGVCVGPLARLGQPGATVQGVGITTQPLPLLGALGQVLVQPQSVPIFSQPGAQRRPLADERLVCHLGRVLAQRDQARIGQDLHHGPHAGCLFVARHELIETRPPTRVLRPLAQLGQPQKDAARDRLLRSRQALVIQALRRLRDRAAHPAGLGVGLQGQGPAAPPPPRLQERVRQQRQGPGLLADVADKEVDQAGFQLPLPTLGGKLDGSPQLLRAHRADILLVRRQGLAQIRVLRAVRVEVGAQRNQDRGRPACLAGLEQVVDECLALERVPTQREQLLELIDDQQGALLSGQRALTPEAKPARVRRQLVEQALRRGCRVVVGPGQRGRQ